MKVILLTFALLQTFFCFSQKAPIKFGDVSVEDLKMTVYAKDSSAEAVILSDYGMSELKYNQSKGFQLFFERIRRVKILTKEGLDWANFNIYLYNNATEEEKISGLKAVTYNLENGKIVETKVKSESIIKEKYSENTSITKVTWPNVKIGSVLELTYSITSDFVFNFQDWEFQSKIPTIWSEYRTRIPEYYYYEKFMQGYVVLDVVEDSKSNSSITLTTRERSSGIDNQTSVSVDKVDYIENRNRWVAKDVPAFKEEPTQAEVLIDVNGNARANVKTAYSGIMYETEGLNNCIHTSMEDQKKWIEENTNIPSFEISSFAMQETRNKNPSIQVTMDLIANRYSSVSGKRLFLMPNLMNRSTYIPEKTESRKHSIVWPLAYTVVDSVTFRIPENLYPEFVPGPIKINSRFGQYENSVKFDQGEIIYTRRFKLNKGEFPAESYTEFMDFYKSVNKSDNLKLVFLNKS